MKIYRFPEEDNYFHKKIWKSIEAFTKIIYTAFGGHKLTRRTLVNVDVGPIDGLVQARPIYII